MQATIPFQHAAYQGNTADGYPTQPQYGAAVERLAYMIQPDVETTVLADDSHTNKVTTRKLVGVVSVEPFTVFDRITVRGVDYILKEIRDMSDSPFPLPFGADTLGALIIERVES